MTDALAALGLRIERVALDPSGIDAQRLFRVVRPLFALTGWRATIQYEALHALRPALAAAVTPETVAAARVALTRATAELEENLIAIERVAIVRNTGDVKSVIRIRADDTCYVRSMT